MNKLSMDDFSHLSEEQLNSLSTGANFLFTVQPQQPNAQAPQAVVQRKAKAPFKSKPSP